MFWILCFNANPRTKETNPLFYLHNLYYIVIAQQSQDTNLAERNQKYCNEDEKEKHTHLHDLQSINFG